MSSLKRESISLFLGLTSALIIQFVTPVLLVRILSKNDFGIFQQFNLITLTIIPILGFGLTTSLYVLFPTANKLKQSKLIIQTIVLLITIGGVFFFIFLIFGSSILSILSLKELRPLTIYIGLYVLLFLGSLLCDEIFVLEKKTKLTILYYPIEKFLKFIIILFFVLYYKNITGIAFALIIYVIIKFIFLIVYTNNNYFIKISKLFDGNIIRDQLRYCLPLAIGVIVNTVSSRMDKFLINKYISPDEFAVYSLSFISIPILSQVYSSLNNVALQKMSIYANQGDLKSIKNLWHNILVKTASITIPSIIIFSLLSKNIFTIMFSDGYSEASKYFTIYIMSYLLIMTGHGLILRSFKKTDLILRANVVSFIVTILFGFILIHKFYIYGAIITALISTNLPIIIILIYEKKLLKLNFTNWFPLYKLLKIIICSLLPIVLLMIIRNKFTQNNIILIMFSFCSYFFIVFILQNILGVFIFPDIKNKILKYIYNK